VHPEDAEAWEWDEGNESHLAESGITPVDVEDIFWNGPKWARNRSHRSGDWKMMGLTRGNRRLTIVLRFDVDRRQLRPITGWEPTKGERRKYFRDLG
jgi:uncharacterized DUF497 family protein